ncbi:hypothetical protein Tco_0745044 [Tanacetum coccineum]
MSSSKDSSELPFHQFYSKDREKLYDKAVGAIAAALYDPVYVSDLLTEFQDLHTLLSLVDPGTGHPISGSRKTLAALTRMLCSRMPGSLSRQLDLHQQASFKTMTACLTKLRWSDEGLERDLYIKVPTVTILAMDGRRTWLDIKELVRIFQISHEEGQNGTKTNTRWKEDEKPKQKAYLSLMGQPVPILLGRLILEGKPDLDGLPRPHQLILDKMELCRVAS